MKFFSSHRWLKLLGITLIVMIAFFCADVFVSVAGKGLHAMTAYAQDLSEGGSGLSIPTGDVEISESIPQKPFGEILISMVNYFIGFLGFLATLAFVYAGVLWILSGGSEESITKAKKIMTYAALGIVVVILSYSVVGFIAGSAGPPSQDWSLPDPTANGDCVSDRQCDSGEVCLYNNDTNLNECTTPQPGNICRDNQDCPLGFACNEATGRCVPSDQPGRQEGGTQGSQSNPVVDENLGNIDELISGLEDALDISGLSDEAEEDVAAILEDPAADLSGKIDDIEAMLEAGTDADGNPLTPNDVRILERLLDGLERLKLLRDELDELNKNRPESQEINTAYTETSDALNAVTDDPADKVKFRRFTTKYKTLKELIRKFPVVQSRIWAYPGEGNVPFTVQFDGLDSIDPTGGTIETYEWTLNGEVIGSEPVIIHEFTEPNTYAVNLRVATSQLDEGGFKTAMDGVSVVRVKANPPAADVRFRINGADVYDIFHVTLDEGQAGLTFDPSPTTPALGRLIEKYEWFYGDTFSEVRLVPTTVVHTYPKAGEYFVKLEVTDNLKITDKRIVKLFVKSLAADIEINPTRGNVNTEFTFTGRGSRSDDGIIRDYTWEIQDPEGRIVVESEEDVFTYRFSRPGLYKIVLLVTDITGAQDKYVRELAVLSRPPVANFTYSVPAQNHPNRFEFNAVDSYDPDEGDSVNYSWDFDGDGTFDVLNTTEALQTYEYEKVGEYRAKLQAEDQFGERDLVEKKVSVPSILSADIVATQRATRVGEPIELSVDTPSAVAYVWEFGDGETESTEETTVTHTYNKTGKFNVKLNFFDAQDNENFDTQRILVGAGEQPLAVISYMVNGREARVVEALCGDEPGAVVTRADLIRFDAKNSINTDGSSRLLSYDWTFPGGEKGSQKDSTFKFDEINREGECFNVSLAVRDQLTGKLSKEDKVYFKVINELPQVTDFVITPPDREELITPAKVQLRVINPKDQDGTIKKYKWAYYREGFPDNLMGVHSTSEPFTEMVITSFGEADMVNRYFFVVEVADNDNGVYISEERFGEVSYLDIKNGPNLSPVAEFTMDKSTISAGDSITFVSRSYDPQGEELPAEAFRWDFDGDGEFDDTSSGPQVNRQFNTPGEYSVRLKVVHRGLSSSVAKTIFVESTESLPQAAFTYEIEGSTVTFDGSHTRFDPTLEDITLRFEWDFDVKDDANGNGIKDDDVQSTEIRPSYTYPEKGLYTVKLNVKDLMGMEGVVVRDVDLSLTEEERLKNAYRSLEVSAPKHPLTTLDIEVIPSVMEKGDSADIKARVLNADSSPYNGKVFFEILDGSGQFTPNPAQAEDSKASVIFTALDSGKVRIRIRATGTLYGELTEEAVINVK
ncbi:PKD domain-containing protein [Candidatus Peregrinibacteria bacterium]|nr:PKD domain-containing protein [Candidatus Peregrinibacteria bacterium]